MGHLKSLPIMKVVQTFINQMKANSNKRNNLEGMAKITRKSNEPTEIIKLLLLNYMLLGGASSGDIKNSHLWKMPHLVSPEDRTLRNCL